MEETNQEFEQNVNTPQETVTSSTTEHETNNDAYQDISQETGSDPISDDTADTLSTSQHLDEPEYLKKRLGRQARQHQKNREESERQHLREKEELAKQYERQLEEMRYNQPNSYGSSQPSTQDDIDLSNPNHLLAAVDELVNQRWIEKENRVRQEATNEKIQNFLQSARKKYSDFDAVVEQYENSPAPNGLGEGLPLLKNADDVLYEVLRNPEEYKKLLNKSQAEVIHRLTEISYRLSSKSQTVSKVQPPIKPLTPSGSPTNLTKTCKERRLELIEESKKRRKR